VNLRAVVLPCRIGTMSDAANLEHNHEHAHAHAHAHDESAIGDIDDKSWLRVPLTDPADVAKRYDEWSSTYDSELHAWGYDAPAVAARIVAQTWTGTEERSVLDVGCGTGLTGVMLQRHNVRVHIDGLDLSASSLEVARTRGVYRSLQQHDFNENRLPFENNSFDAAECIGVMSYAHNPRRLIADMVRVVRSGGTVVFTQRSDLWISLSFSEMLEAMQAEHSIRTFTSSEPLPYMPGNADFADQILVHYATLTVA
jgi:ubiquinone/menaquinone biosynthesis C-methylase UbiE